VFGGVLYRGGTYEKGKKMKSCGLLYNGLCYKQMLEKSGTRGVRPSPRFMGRVMKVEKMKTCVYVYISSLLRDVFKYQ
jgi:hypothetical protein